MTWLTTWPHDGAPKYTPHASEQAAEEHAKTLRTTGRPAVAFWSEGAEDETETTTEGNAA